MIAASSRSALTLKTAVSASSAPTTIRSAFPFAITPTVNCHDIFGPSSSQVRLRTSTHWHRPFACELGLLCAWVFSRAALMSMSLSIDAPGSTYPVRQREWGGRRFNGHHILNDPPHGALHVLA